MKKVLYLDMDNVLVAFRTAIARLSEETLIKYEGNLDNVPGIFALMAPVDGALESYNHLVSLFDTYILSTAPWHNPTAWSDKLHWVKRHLGDPAYKRLILTHHKNLNRGDYLVDDRPNNGADRFQGEHILFGSERFPDWPTVVAYLNDNA
jgi:5'-nucleotidase